VRVLVNETGFGKTLAFSLPIIERFRKVDAFGKEEDPLFLIIVPTKYFCLYVGRWWSRW
jgi:superfamily II DNA/RNA helicase